MQILPKYKDTPFIEEKLGRIKRLIKIDRDAIKMWNEGDPHNPHILRIQEQLANNLRIYSLVTGKPLCQI